MIKILKDKIIKKPHGVYFFKCVHCNTYFKTDEIERLLGTDSIRSIQERCICPKCENIAYESLY